MTYLFEKIFSYQSELIKLGNTVPKAGALALRQRTPVKTVRERERERERTRERERERASERHTHRGVLQGSGAAEHTGDEVKIM